jgi:nucleotide-binding universal stress UspA family protein
VALCIVHAAPYATPDNKPGRRRVTAILGRAYTVAHQYEPHVPARTEQIDEQPVRVLVNASSNAQLLVIGMRGERPSEIVVASTALAVSGAARCPVVVVRGQHYAGEVDAPVVLGLEDCVFDAPAVTAAFADAQRRRAPLIVLHAQHQNRVTDGDVAKGALVVHLAPWRSQYPQVPVEVRVVQGAPADELLRAAVTAQLVVVGTHGRGAPARVLLGSTSRTVVRYSPCPVMVVRWDAVVRDAAPDPTVSAVDAGASGPSQAAPLHQRTR